jgi:hypothetical protein
MSLDDESLDGVEMWDPATGEFSVAGPLATSRTGHTATALPSGLVLVAGGREHRHESGDGAQPDGQPAPELWDPATGSSTPAGTMAAARVGHTATLLEDRRVLIVGGVERPPDRDDPLPPYAELYTGR